MTANHFIIFAADVQVLTGLSLRQSQRILQQARKKFNKEKGHLVTIFEFCAYCEFPLEEVQGILHKMNKSRNTAAT